MLTRPGDLARSRWFAFLAALSAAALGYAAHHPPGPLAVPLLAPLVLAVAAFLQIPPGIPPRVIAVRPGSYAVHPMTLEHTRFAAELHHAALPHGFFAQLGTRFLRGYYRVFVASPYAIALVADSDEQPLGMVVGAAQPAAHMRWVLRHQGWRLAALGAAALAGRPLLAARFVRTRVARYARAWVRARRGAEAPQPADARATAFLSHVAVLDGARGTGVGSALVAAFAERARADGAERVTLTTLDGPDGAAAFYRREGWSPAGTTTGADGQRSLAFSLELAPDA